MRNCFKKIYETKFKRIRKKAYLCIIFLGSKWVESAGEHFKNQSLMTFETIKTIGKILSGIVLYRMVTVLFVLCLPVISFANSLTSNNLLECKSSHQALFSHKMYAINCETLGKIRKRYELAKTQQRYVSLCSRYQAMRLFSGYNWWIMW